MTTPSDVPGVAEAVELAAALERASAGATRIRGLVGGRVRDAARQFDELLTELREGRRLLDAWQDARRRAAAEQESHALAVVSRETATQREDLERREAVARQAQAEADFLRRRLETELHQASATKAAAEAALSRYGSSDRTRDENERRYNLLRSSLLGYARQLGAAIAGPQEVDVAARFLFDRAKEAGEAPRSPVGLPPEEVDRLARIDALSQLEAAAAGAGAGDVEALVRRWRVELGLAQPPLSLVIDADRRPSA